jgi:hypothetical protein
MPGLSGVSAEHAIMKAAGSFERLVLYQTRRRHIPVRVLIFVIAVNTLVLKLLTIRIFDST